MTEERTKGKELLDKLTDKAVKAPVHCDQREVEMQLLATLARVINSDQLDLKYGLLEMRATDFQFRDHQLIFEAMKKLADAGDVVDLVTVRAKVGDTCSEALDAVFDGSGAYIGAADTYKQKVLSWSTGRTKSKNR